MPVPEEREEWTAKMFLAVGGRGRTPVKPWPGNTWHRAAGALGEALEEAERQVAALEQGLKKQGDPDLAEIAAHGLDEVLGAHPKRLRDALGAFETLELEARTEALKALGNALDALSDDLKRAVVEACDENPFGVSVSLRETLGGPADKLARATSAAM